MAASTGDIPPSLDELIYNLEDQTWKAMSSQGSALLPFLAQDCIMLFPMGLKVSASTSPNLHDVMTSEAFIPWTSYKMSDVEVTPLGRGAAIISYKAEGTRPPPLQQPRAPDQDFNAMVSSAWRIDPASGRWLLCFHQQTPFHDVDIGEDED